MGENLWIFPTWISKPDHEPATTNVIGNDCIADPMT